MFPETVSSDYVPQRQAGSNRKQAEPGQATANSAPAPDAERPTFKQPYLGAQ